MLFNQLILVRKAIVRS